MDKAFVDIILNKNSRLRTFVVNQKSMIISV